MSDVDAKAQAQEQRARLDEIEERIEREDPYRPIWQLALISLASLLRVIVSLPLAVVIYALSIAASLLAWDETILERATIRVNRLVVHPWITFLAVGGAVFHLPYARLRRAIRRRRRLKESK